MIIKSEPPAISIAGIPLQWDQTAGVCSLGGLPVIMVWTETTLARLMAGVQAMVGTERFALALQSEGRKSITEDWQVIAAHPSFEEGFQAIATIAATAGWGDWNLIFIDTVKQECIFHIRNSWESRYQQALGVNWGCGMIAGKLAGYCTKFFNTNCWAEQTSFAAIGSSCDTFIVRPSPKNVEQEIDNLLATDEATRADMAVALTKLKQEIQARTQAEQELRLAQQKLEERVREESLKYRESSRKYQKLVEDTNDLIAHLDQRGRINFINKAAQEVFDLRPKDYFGVSIFRFIHPDDRKKVKQWWNKCLTDKTCQTSIELRQLSRTPGTIYYLQWSASFQYDENGQMSGIGAIGRDVSATRKAEQDYKNLISKMLDGFALHEIICQNGIPTDYRFLSVNPSFETLTGLRASDLIGKTVLEVLPATEKHWIETYGRVALTGQPFSFENYAAELDKYFEVAAYCPAPNQFACIFQDITPRKKAEQEKVRLEKQLRRRHKMEAIGTLAGGIAHDFNNILAAILGYSDMAMENLPAWSPAKNQLQEVLKAGHRAKNLVRQILAFSHREEHHREPVNLNILVRETIVFLRSTLPTTINILLDLDPGCGNILADQTQIHQVLMNICTNASQAMVAGGTLSLCLKELPPVGNTFDRDINLPPIPFIRLDVSDTGPGIREEYFDRIFDPYFTTKEFGKGSGMGLAVVHGIVKSHDGFIKVTNSMPQGACFSLYFPRTDQEVPAPIVDDPTHGLGCERLLVVDDDPSIGRMLQTFMNKQGYTTTIITSSRTAFELVQADPHAFDLIITDQTMPEMTGEDLTIKILRLRPDIPIILCTGYSNMIDELKAKDLGIKAFHMKPVSLKELAASVRRLLDRQ